MLNLGSEAWIKGETEYFDLTWRAPFIPTDPNDIKIVVFIQDDQTSEILQAADWPKFFSYDPWQSGYHYNPYDINCDA